MKLYSKPIFTYLLIPLLLGSLLSCQPTEQDDKTYVQKINDWHASRIQSLKKTDGWLTLAGLYPLGNGTYSFGADSSNDFVFPPGKAPSRIGRFIHRSDSITELQIENDIEVEVDGKTVSDTTLLSDADENGPSVMTLGPLEWYIIERGGEFFVRLKDTEHPNLESFEGIDRYPVEETWKVEATFAEYDQPRTIRVPNVLGQENEEPLYGTLQFSIEGEQFEVAPLGNPDGDRFFIIFGDDTNGKETYGGGRFVYADTPGRDGITHIDFNKSYNPPCVFTEFATCPLPPAENKLPVKITAGEKNYDGGGEH